MRYLAAALAGLTLLSGPALADDGTRHEVLAKLATRVKKLLEGRSADEVRLGVLAGDRQPEANAGPGLMYDFQRVLASLKVKVSDKAAFEVRGRYEMVHRKNKDDGPDGIMSVELELELFWHTKGEVVARIKGYFTYREDVLEVAGLTVSLSGNPSAEEVNKTLKAATDDEKKVFIDGSNVSAAKGSPYGLELLMKTPAGYTPVKPVAKKGEAYAELHKDAVYAVRITNNSKYEAAVRLSIDGLNVFSFAKGIKADEKDGYPRILIPAGASRLVKGWPIDLEGSREFLVAAYPDTAAAIKLKRPDANLGLVSVTIVPCWEKGKTPEEFKAARTPLGTGFGEPVKTPLKIVHREFAKSPTAIHIRYTPPAK